MFLMSLVNLLVLYLKIWQSKNIIKSKDLPLFCRLSQCKIYRSIENAVRIFRKTIPTVQQISTCFIELCKLNDWMDTLVIKTLVSLKIVVTEIVRNLGFSKHIYLSSSQFKSVTIQLKVL